MESVLSLCGWAIIPHCATFLVQNAYYRFTINSGKAHPPRDSPQHARDYRRIYVGVVTTYLLYSFGTRYAELRSEGDYYSLLGVTPSDDEREIRARFRRLAAVHHPDKIRDAVPDDKFFVQLKLAQETLLDPTRRFIYNRFGPDVVGSLVEGINYAAKSLFWRGLMNLLPQYLYGLAVVSVLNIFWFSPWGKYWRYFIFFSLFTLELTLLTHPNLVFQPFILLPGFIARALRLDTFYLLPFQILTLARTASVLLNLFITQVAPSANSTSQASTSSALTPAALKSLAAVAALSRDQADTSARLLAASVAPFHSNDSSGDSKALSLRRGMMHEFMVHAVRANSKEVQEAVADVKAKANDGLRDREEEKHKDDEHAEKKKTNKKEKEKEKEKEKKEAGLTGEWEMPEIS